MPTLTFKATAISLASACLLSACQTETTSRAANEAPKSAPMVQAAPVVSNSTTPAASGATLSGPVATASGSWDRGGRNGLVLAGMLRNVDGMTAVCGVKVIKGSDKRELNSAVMAAYKFYVGNTMIAKGTSHFASARSTEDIKTTPVSCKSTSKPWNPEFAKGPWTLRHSGTTTF